ncbi:cytochrome b-c1 complex subunit 2, mitochondrial [Anopheles arabiensis]|uniref:Peptidase M16 N-terminal domain-containing protein n=3 Tax=gambiae species complex TaxID=44542 RepID=A0A6E8VNU9_ANOCL|nr:cytochrome b-c1 complex subunit 2, mitochondrial [Anopheles arabiensis]XP_040222116.2 cytochrome b-c1 complex subunit 2, mitochondrial [Anopheles coluzzii]
MASVTSKTPMLRAAAARGFAAHAQAAAASRGSAEVQTTTLPNKLVVASADPNAAVSRISIVFRAGSRNETADCLGAAHVLRAAGGLSTKTATAFGITRNIQQAGGSLTTAADRELVTYSVAVTKDQLEVGLKYLEATATGQVFKPWELAELTPIIRNELARLPVEVQAVELLHKAAFRDGLGNSVFCPDYLVGKHSSETMQHYFAANCTTNRAAVAGVGVDHQMLVGFAQSLALESGAGGENKSAFNTGEVRREGAGSRAAVAVGAQAVGWSSMKEAMAFWVLQHAAGVGAATKRGTNNGVLTKALAGVNSSSLYNGYSDNGMFGFVLSGDAKDAGKAVEAGVKALKSLSVSDADVARGKASALAAAAEYTENQSTLLHQLGEESALLGQVYKKSDLLAAVNAVTTGDVQAAARKVASSKLAIGAVGNLSHVPHLCELH